MYQQIDDSFFPRPIVESPANVFNKCPSCFSTRLIKVTDQVICCECDWMSIEGFIDAGGMDPLAVRFRDAERRREKCKQARKYVRKKRDKWRDVVRQHDLDVFEAAFVA